MDLSVQIFPYVGHSDRLFSEEKVVWICLCAWMCFCVKESCVVALCGGL